MPFFRFDPHFMFVQKVMRIGFLSWLFFSHPPRYSHLHSGNDASGIRSLLSWYCFAVIAHFFWTHFRYFDSMGGPLFTINVFSSFSHSGSGNFLIPAVCQSCQFFGFLYWHNLVTSLPQASGELFNTTHLLIYVYRFLVVG